ncbi:MAG: hypothetical protein ACYCVY_06225 [Acidiferrobacteraceae bacterium]
MTERPLYEGFERDTHGMTMLGRVVLDAWLFGLIPRTEDCAGWDLQRMQHLVDQVNKRWDEYGNLPSRLPPELMRKHQELYQWAMERARARGWDPELGEED